MVHRILVFAVLACSDPASESRPPPRASPAPLVSAPTPATGTPPLASPTPTPAPPVPGAILREHSLADSMPVSALAVVGDRVVFTTLSAGVYAMPITGGKITKLDDGRAFAMVNDAEAAYTMVSNAGSSDVRDVVRLDHDGKKSTLSRWRGYAAVGVDARQVYLRGDRSTARAPKVGGPTIRLPCNGTLKVGGDWLYCMDRRLGTITRMDPDGRRVTTLARSTTGTLTEGPALTERYVYASTEGPGAIVRVPREGGKLEVVEKVGNIYHLAGDGDEVYWIETHHPGPRKMVVRRLRDASSAPQVFFEKIGYGRDLAFAGSSVFIADSGEGIAHPRILELAR